MISHSKPTISEKDIAAVSEVLKSGKISQGEQIENFEKKLSLFVGHKEGVAVHSGTSALHLALMALEISKGDEVALPSFVCSSPLHAVKYVDATPLFIDINPETLNMDPEDLKKKITQKTRAIILPHMFGLPADIDAIIKTGVPLIEDCAHSLGATYRDRPVGSYGLLSIYSFYATKMIATGEGGMLSTDSKELLERARDLRDYDKKEDYTVRYNYKMSDMEAALGISQLSRLSEFIQKRKEIAMLYHQELKNLPLEIPKEYDDRTHIYYRYIVKVTGDLLAFQERLAKEGVICERPVFKPLHRYFDLPPCLGAEKAWENSLSIPIYPSLTDGEIEKIIHTIKRVSQ
jgi:perosamine synthetase